MFSTGLSSLQMHSSNIFIIELTTFLKWVGLELKLDGLFTLRE